jgi:ribosomal protein S4E
MLSFLVKYRRESVTKLKFIFVLLCIGITISIASADSDIMIGNYGHKFTEPQGEVVWSIRKEGDSLVFFSHGLNESIVSQIANTEQKESFWKKMWWDASLSKDATCVVGKEFILCKVPQEVRAKIDWIAPNKSDYFYYDSMAGIMEIERLKP